MIGQPIVTGAYIPPREPERCPKCNKPEDIKEVCKNCGYEYPEDEENFTGVDYLVGASLLIGNIYIIVTLLCWVTSDNHYTLLGIIQSQFQWLIRLRIW